MNHAKWLSVLITLTLALAAPSTRADEDEEFEIQKEGQLFDFTRTGLYYKRVMYHDGEDATHITHFPIYYNGTVDMKPWLVFISHWEQDPPSFVNVYVQDDTPNLYKYNIIDLKISINHYDDARNMIPANATVFTDIKLQKGINRVPLNIHNYKGDIVSIKVVGRRLEWAISPAEVAID